MLSQLNEKIRSCQNCGLRSTCSIVVTGEGPENACVVFLGEAPGKEEDEQGRPFVGRSGQFLRAEMRSHGIEPDSVYITNACRCRPPENRTPTFAETESCWPWTEETLKIIKPKIIVTLGKPALEIVSRKFGFLNKVLSNQIVKLAGIPLFVKQNNLYVFPMFHPSYACRRNDARATFSGHLQYLKLAIPGWLTRPTDVGEKS